jgi:hypothetical protein
VGPGAVTDSGTDLSTWLFLGALAGATVAALAFYGRAIHGWTPPEPRTDLVTPDHFTRMRGVESEVDLGRGWRATDDPGASWHLFWMPGSGDIVGLRTSELPPPPGPYYLGSVGPRSVLDAYGVHKFTGMKVLGSSGDRPTRALCEDLRPRPDGLDRLTGGTHPPGDDWPMASGSDGADEAADRHVTDGGSDDEL